MASPLQGIRVIECANWLAAPSGCALMADLGADVIKVEPPTGDPFRAFQLAWIRKDLPLNPNFQMDNRGKRSITIDLTHADGPELLRRLAGQADIFVTNLLPGRQERYGLSYDAMKSRFPRLVHVSVSGFGSIGPSRDKLGFDYSAFWASSGLMGLMGEPGTAPPVQRPGMGDHSTSLNVLAATLAALRRREQGGEGLSVDVSLLATGTWVLSSDLSAAVVARKIPPRYSREKPLNPIWNAYPTQDGRWVLLVMPHPDEYWPALCRAVGREQWIADPRYDTKEKRAGRNRELVDELDRAFGERTIEEWKERLNKEEIIWSAVLDLPRVLNDPQAEAQGHFEEIEHPDAGTFRTLAAPFRILGADIRARGPAPEVGQHTEEVLADCGIDWDEIGRLRESGVLG